MQKRPAWLLTPASRPPPPSCFGGCPLNMTPRSDTSSTPERPQSGDLMGGGDPMGSRDPMGSCGDGAAAISCVAASPRAPSDVGPMGVGSTTTGVGCRAVLCLRRPMLRHGPLMSFRWTRSVSGQLPGTSASIAQFGRPWRDGDVSLVSPSCFVIHYVTTLGRDGSKTYRARAWTRRAMATLAQDRERWRTMEASFD